MRLTESCDIALRVLTYATSCRHRLFTIDEIVNIYNLPRGTVMKVVNTLTRGDFLTAQRGRAGGLRLAQQPSQVLISDVILHVEPDLGLVECMRPGNQCRITRDCRLIDPLQQALRTFVDTLRRYTLADIALPPASFGETEETPYSAAISSRNAVPNRSSRASSR